MVTFLLLHTMVIAPNYLPQGFIPSFLTGLRFCKQTDDCLSRVGLVWALQSPGIWKQVLCNMVISLASTVVSYVTFLTHCQRSKSEKNGEKLKINFNVPVSKYFNLQYT